MRSVTLFDLLGGMWGYILTIAILFVGMFCYVELGISPSPKNAVLDGKLAYQACETMKALMEIDKEIKKAPGHQYYGSYRLIVGEGKHLDLYKQFIEVYPELASKGLKKLAKMRLERKNICSD